MAFPLFDTHCHLQDAQCGDGAQVLVRAREAGVTHMVCCATREEDWPAVLALARQQEGIVPMLGIHPWFAGDLMPGWEARLEAHLRDNRAFVGECGLDFAKEGLPDASVQVAVLRAQLRLAHRYHVPVSLHCLRAWTLLKQVLQEEGVPRAGAVMHAFSGSVEMMQEALSLGFHISFATTVADPRRKRAREALQKVPLDKWLIESDAPAQPLAGHRSTSEPADLSLILPVASLLRQESIVLLAEYAYRNAWNLFIR